MKSNQPPSPGGNPENNINIEQVIERLRKRHVQFPAGPWDLRNISDEAVQELARRGLVKNGELYDGTLSHAVAQSLESAGITTRAELRRRYWANDLNLLHLRNVGPVRAKEILAWADMAVPPLEWQSVPLDLTRETWRSMDQLVKHCHLTGRAELITELVAEEHRRLKTGSAGESKK